jgi:hypothetical protein
MSGAVEPARRAKGVVIFLAYLAALRRVALATTSGRTAF